MNSLRWKMARRVGPQQETNHRPKMLKKRQLGSQTNN